MAGGPTERREESVQFSLKELLKLEDERLAESSRERNARESAAMRAREDAERQRAAAAVEAERATAEARERERRAELDELARREAMQKAIVEQSRLTVDVRARAEERELERRHEIEIERLRVAGKKGQLGPLIGASLLGGAIMLLVVLGVYFGVTKPASDRRVAEIEQDIATADGRATAASKNAEAQRRTSEGLEQKLHAAEAQIAALGNAVRPPPAAVGSAKPSPTTVSPNHPPPPKPVICLAGDPMCPAISTH